MYTYVYISINVHIYIFTCIHASIYISIYKYIYGARQSSLDPNAQLRPPWLPSEEGTTHLDFRTCTWKPSPESGFDCRVCAVFPSQSSEDGTFKTVKARLWPTYS